MRRLLGVFALFLSCFWISVSPARGDAPRRVALVIANESYSSASTLANPSNDGKLVATSLRRAGFQTVIEVTDVNVAAFRAALRNFRMRASGAEVALIYFAGHGIEANGKNWLIPTDARLASALDLPDEAIDLDRMLDSVLGASLRMVILDSCRDNPFGRNWRGVNRSFTRGLGVADVDDVLVMYAAAPGQVASDGSDGNSPFAKSLARRLAEPGLLIQLLAASVRDDVLAATGNRQRPYFTGSLTSRPFYLVPAVASVGSAPQFPLQAPVPASARVDPALLAPGTVFRDCASTACPEMVRLAPGRFLMGPKPSETGEAARRGPPQTPIDIARVLSVSQTEVTNAQWAHCVAAGICDAKPGAAPDHPVTDVSWMDARDYADWLSELTGARYRLPSDAEWEFAARGGTVGDFSYGSEEGPNAGCNYANLGDAARATIDIIDIFKLVCADRHRDTIAPVASYKPNPFGLFDVHGNVWEWVEDCWGADLSQTPRDGRAREVGCRAEDPRVVRGGSWRSNNPSEARSHHRASRLKGLKAPDVGFRVVRD
jgi:formylglycine-generating enzyme required for sulfatase activity